MPQSSPSISGRTVFGYAARFSVLSRNLGGPRDPWYEEILPGAFPPLERQDVRALFNHDKNGVLARSKNGKGTLRLSIDGIGLRYEFTAPETTLGNDLLESLKRGDIDGASFAFTVQDDRWTKRDGKRIRQIVKIAELHDISVVTEGAYDAASAAARHAPGRPDTSHLSPSDQVLLAQMGIL